MMDKTNRIIILFGSFFVGLFLLSFFVPDTKYAPKEDNYYTSLIAQYGEMEDKIKEQQHKYFKSREQDEREYYRTVDPNRDNNNPDFFRKSHPLQEAPLQERPLQERPLQERPLQENPLPRNPLR